MPVLVVSFVASGTAFYLMLDPLRPETRALLQRSQADERVHLRFSFEGLQHWFTYVGKGFEQAPNLTDGLKPISRDAWVARLYSACRELPALFATTLPRARQCRDHRAVCMVPRNPFFD